MDAKIEIFIKHLAGKFPHLSDARKTFEWCSRDKNTKICLVGSKVYSLDFDKLTEWMYKEEKPQSADALCFNDNSAVLIEFKSGDPTTHEKKLQKLIDNVVGKIDDSDNTLTLLYDEAFPNSGERLKQSFFLVVDSKKMGIDPLMSTLVGLSLKDNKNAKDTALLQKVKPNLKQGIRNPAHYDTIDVWYSELFSHYLNLHKISDFNLPEKMSS